MHGNNENSHLARLTGGGTSTSERLCFDKNEFMKANFSVDEFLHKNRNAPSLEQLRDNLGLYLKGLRASMIDLINEDYADFVSLSANLVGLDQTIETIQHPLEQFRDDIQSIQNLIAENVKEIRAQLEQKQKLRDLKRNLLSLKKVYQTIEKLNFLLTNKLSGEKSANVVDLERASLDLIQLKFNEKYCAAYLKKEEVEQIEKLELNAHQKLRELFNASLKSATSTSSEELERCLRIYITLGACNVAEKVFREDVVAPYMSGIISEQQLQNSPQGLAGIYSKILNFISLHMTNLLRLTQYSDKLKGFNFVVNSYWADVEQKLEIYMTSIFAPGNSEIFYAKYKCTRDFMSKIEELLISGGDDETSLNEFRQHKQTKSFQGRWNLPVYFQICFQEIAGSFEATLLPLLHDDSLVTNSKYNFVPFNAAEQAIQRCWSEGVYLAEVFPKFYKLNVLIVLRLSRWIKDVLDHLCNGSKAQLKSEKQNKSQMLIALHTDIRKFGGTLPELQQQILKNVPKERSSSILLDSVNRSIADLSEVLHLHLTFIQNALVELLITESGSDNVRQVNDLPRLFRKTNRDVPSRCSGYVEQMLRPLKVFATEYESQLGSLVVEEILTKVLSSITTDYCLAVSEVLTSVQKTEESLRRLRNLKGGQQQTPTASTSISDDDKIRLQLRVDVLAWTEELLKLNFESTKVAKLLELNSIVEESIKLKDNGGGGGGGL